MSLPVLRAHSSGERNEKPGYWLEDWYLSTSPRLSQRSAITRDYFSSAQPRSRVLPFSIYVPSLHLKESACYEQGLELEFFTPSGDIHL